jgi:hypothetical protein
MTNVCDSAYTSGENVYQFAVVRYFKDCERSRGRFSLNILLEARKTLNAASLSLAEQLDRLVAVTNEIVSVI